MENIADTIGPDLQYCIYDMGRPEWIVAPFSGHLGKFKKNFHSETIEIIYN